MNMNNDRNYKLSVSSVALLLLAMLLGSMLSEAMLESVGDDKSAVTGTNPLRMKRFLQAGKCPCRLPEAPCCSKWGYCGSGSDYCSGGGGGGGQGEQGGLGEQGEQGKQGGQGGHGYLI